MAWQEKITNELLIVTGDLRLYAFPLWVNPSKTIEWNVTDFSFINTDGVLSKRAKLLGRKYHLEFYIQGDNHLEEYAKFERSANDKGAWQITHPYYGAFNATVKSMEVDNSSLNVTKITCTAVETITEENPQAQFNTVDTIRLKKEELDTKVAQNLTEPPSPNDVDNLRTVSSRNFNLVNKLVETLDDASVYFQAFSTLNNAINGITAAPIIAMNEAVAFISAPGQFAANVQYRLQMLVDTFSNLRVKILNLFSIPAKKLFFIQATANISSMFEAAVTPLPGNYTNSLQALATVDTLNVQYRQYLEDIDSLQGLNGSNPDYFIPDYESMQLLHELYTLTVSNLLQIAMNGKMEISVFTEDDSNVISLTHKYYGKDNFDENIQNFINQNNLSYREIGLGIKKGRKIVYYK